ncbi:MAG: hypothetical protein Q7S65_04555 [Nanoarchaeota archaeon]|nr:hypothetical protein [Nanoarchaeota archaeon]
MKQAIVTGCTSEFGEAYVNVLESAGYPVVGISRSAHESGNHEHVSLDLSDSQATARFVHKRDLAGLEHLVLVHGVGSFVFEEHPGPMDLEAYTSNYLTFMHLAEPLRYRVMHETRAQLTVVSFGSVSDRYEVPFWQTYSRCNRQRKEKLRDWAVQSHGRISAVFITLATIDTRCQREMRPHADRAYWASPQSVAEKTLPAILSPSGYWAELAPFAPPPERLTDAYYANLPAIRDKWMREMGRTVDKIQSKPNL